MKRRNFLTNTTKAAAVLPFATSSDLFVGDTKKVLNKEINLELPDKFHRSFFYKPVNAWAADFIPLYAKGAFQLFYLQDWRNVEEYGEGTPWWRVSTNDFVNFTEHGEMLPRGTKKDQDLFVFTGSAIEANGKYHIFYTGHNPYFPAEGKPQEGVMHAMSDDLLHWEKFPDQTFYAPSSIYEANDWRDPFVFWNEEEKQYNMLCAARFKEGLSRRKGLTALCASKDLVKWEVKEPFYAPNLYYTHECPDLFKMGDWWYLLFSEFTSLVRTRYRMSRSLKGPWLTPRNDTFDGHAFYAAKTASDGNRRFLFGWNPTRTGTSDTGGWNWGGNLVVHEIRQEANGELSVKVPDTINATFNKRVVNSFTTNTGEVTSSNSSIKLKAPGSFAASLAGDMPVRCKIETTISFDKGVKGCGIMLRSDDDFENTYYIRLVPQDNQLVFDPWPRQKSEVFCMVELSRPVSLQPDTPVNIKIFVDGSVGVVYVNDKVAMNCRMYNHRSGRWGVFVENGNAQFEEIKMTTTG